MVAAALSFLTAVPASAASQYNLTATSKTATTSDFSLTYLDTDFDTLFSFNELLTFSGVTFFDEEYNILATVPEVDGFTDGGFDPRYIGGNNGDWSLVRDDVTDTFIPIAQIDADNFSYETTPIPLPAGLPLLITGLAGFAGLRMRKKRAAQV